MNRWLAREALLGSAAVLASLGTACKPDQSVKGGAPVLMEMIIASGGGATHILPDTPDCPAPTADPDAGADGGGGGMVDGSTCAKGGSVCRLESAKNWCTCVADEMDMTKAAWSCPPFGPVAGVVAVFDRLLDVSMFTPDAPDGNTAPNTASLDLPAGSPTATASINYGANGSTTGLIAHLFGYYHGPNLTITGSPALPSGTAVTVSLNKTTVRAKDGKTAFVGEGVLLDGAITFTTGPFTADIATPPEGMDGDGGTLPPAPDMTPATVTFSNVVDIEAILSHITVTSGATPVPFTLDPAAGAGTSVNIVPTGTWPASSTITITLNPTTPDVLNETLGAAVMASFMTGAP
jgi:hypothetical protein